MKLKILNLLKNKNESFGWYTHRLFASNGRQEVDDGHSDEISDDLRTPAVIELDRCDMKPVSLLNIRQKT